MDDFGTGLTAACSDVFGYWSNKAEDAYPDQFILRCLGKRNCDAGVTWDLQGSKDDFSLSFCVFKAAGNTITTTLGDRQRAQFLRQRQGTAFSPADIGKAIGAGRLQALARLLQQRQRIEAAAGQRHGCP